MSGFGLCKAANGFMSHSPEQVFDDNQIVDAALEYLVEHGFPYRTLSKHDCMQKINKLANTDNEELLYSVMGYDVADNYHPHRFEGRYHESKYSPVEAFGLSKDWIRTCLERSLKYDKVIRLTTLPGFHRSSGCGVKVCSNFRPGFALLQYRKFCEKGAVVLDASTGYGGRLVGWMASECGGYIGVDPNTKVYEGNLRMAHDFGRSNDVELHCCPAEDLEHDKVSGRCDFAFTSPPYFGVEVYSNQETQSCHRWQGAIEWRNGFLLPMMRLQYAALKPGCMSCVNIADVKFKGKVLPLVKWCIQAGQKSGFEFEGQDTYHLRRHFGSGGDKNKYAARTEAVLKFRKV